VTTDLERLLHGHGERATEVLPPIIRLAAEALRIRDEAEVQVLGDAIARAYALGVNDADARNGLSNLRARTAFEHEKLHAAERRERRFDRAGDLVTDS
jgi:hypothetical protein